jgi:hypothetical protein
MAKQVELCNHIKANGTLCESPALRNTDFCFFHTAGRERIKRQRRAARRKLPLQLPLLEDSASVQLAIGDTLNALLAGQIDHKTAGLVLYGLQTAASNVRHCSFEVEEGSRHYVEYNSDEEDLLEQEIAEEIAAEQQEAARCGSELVRIEFPAEKPVADPALPPKKASESAANGSARKKACTT